MIVTNIVGNNSGSGKMIVWSRRVENEIFVYDREYQTERFHFAGPTVISQHQFLGNVMYKAGLTLSFSAASNIQTFPNSNLVLSYRRVGMKCSKFMIFDVSGKKPFTVYEQPQVTAVDNGITRFFMIDLSNDYKNLS